MATIEQICKENSGANKDNSLLFNFKYKPASIREILTPLLDAGFEDFTWVGAGVNSFVIAPSDNPNIVFRVTTERDTRSSNNPFFLCKAYGGEHYHDSFRNSVKLEILLAGKKEIPDKDKEFLFNEMRLAGWHPERIQAKEHFWSDVVMVSLRDENGRMKSVPIISDPSEESFIRSVLPSMPDGNYIPLRERNAAINAVYNRCGPNYITLQDQANAYNTIIDADPRLKKLIPEPIVFPETEVIQAPPISRPVSK